MSRPAFPMQVIALASVVTAAILSVLCWQIWHAYDDLRDSLRQEFRLEELRGQMTYLEEARSMAVRMAALTGDSRWEHCYREREPQMHAIVEEARHLAPEVFEHPAAEAAAQADARRDEIENQALQRVRQGDLKGAQALLADPEYERDHAIHVHGVGQIVASIRDRNVANLGRHQHNAWHGALDLFIALPLVAVVWMGIGGFVRRRVRDRDRAEKMLREGLAFYNGITESMNQGMFVLDRDFHYRMWNAAMERMFKRSREELIGTGLQPWDVFPYVTEEGVDAMIRLAMGGQAAEREGIRCTMPDGTVRYTAETYLPVRADGEPPGGVLGIVRDVTEARHAAEALRESERLFRSTFEQAAVGMAHVETTGRFLRVNQRLCDMLGYSREDLLAGKLEDVVHPASRAAETAEALRLVAGEIDTYTIEMRFLRADGSEVPVLATASLLRDEAGEPRYFIDVVQDISERKRADEEIASLARFPEENPNPILRISVDGTILYGNEASVPLLSTCGCERGGPVRGALADLHTEAVRTGRPGIGEITVADGVFSLSFAPISESGYVNIYAMDVTARKRADVEREKLQSQVRYAQKLESLGVLAGGIAHDFNNLLVAILGNADLALRDSPPESPVRPGLESIKRAAIRASDLTNQMLAYSGKGRLVVERLDISRLVEEMAHLLKVSISKNVTLRFDLDDSLPPVEADATQLRQVVMNLITNASEAIGAEQGAVQVVTGVMDADRAYIDHCRLAEGIPEGRYAYVEVSDTGCGMDDETMARLFDPFFTTKFTGRGLGLAAVLGIVRGHRGAIRVQSSPGEGSTFRVLLPAVETGQAEAPRAAPAEGVETWRGQGTVLVIDDEEGVRSVARSMLERLGFDVLTAADGAEGLESYRQDPDRIKLVMLDVTMPRLGGEQTLREIRLLRPEAKVILSSGYPEDAAARQFAGMGLSGFIQKPFGMWEMVAKLRAALEEGEGPVSEGTGPRE